MAPRTDDPRAPLLGPARTLVYSSVASHTLHVGRRGIGPLPLLLLALSPDTGESRAMLVRYSHARQRIYCLSLSSCSVARLLQNVRVCGRRGCAQTVVCCVVSMYVHRESTPLVITRAQPSALLRRSRGREIIRGVHREGPLRVHTQSPQSRPWPLEPRVCTCVYIYMLVCGCYCLCRDVSSSVLCVVMCVAPIRVVCER